LPGGWLMADSLHEMPAAQYPGAGPSILVFLLGWLAWLLLAATLELQEVLAGALVSLLVTLLSRAHLGIYAGVRFHAAAPLHLLAFLVVFLRALVLANFDMARRVLSPRLPIRPAIVEVETRMKSTLGRLLLTNAITLTPGTLSLDVLDNIILVHWVDCPPGLDMEEQTRAIVSGFERHLAGFLR
jgi:multicomponent Na+:H+ antiporter subunit E